MTELTGDCFSCQNDLHLAELPPRERVAADEHWRVAHAIGTSVPGWLVLLPRRHVTAIAELSDAEAAGLGTWQVRLSRALHAVVGCEKTYVAQFAEAAGFGHVHFHIIPRMADLPEDSRGPRMFQQLGREAHEAVPDRRMDEIAVALQRELAGESVS
ncbi:HIT family protein [Catenulispora sp. NF23]|uniref:HIT family protein n=2 Tax=Catenulispora pinistramenti TaxID=2705254 RepID=A0ABS5KWH1_9ACTN|nr:HIT family protein [Catenulispora pinistramenti]MBS2550396.1 HIT family protein [Catenulispora pinistramenti]